jgi:tetratricopeptide (TPR) repeat protein
MLKKSCLLLLGLILVPCSSHAEIKTYAQTVKQSFGGSQSPDDARIAAIAKAKREVLEKAGTYLESLTIVKNSVVEKDEILALAAGVLNAEIVSQENYHTKDAFGIIVVAKVDVDTNILEKRVERLFQDRELLKKYNQSKKREKELLAKIERLEEENRRLRTSPETDNIQKKNELTNQFRKTTQRLTAVEWFEKALALLMKGGHFTDPKLALDYLSRALQLDTNYGDAYYNRGVAHGDLGQYHKAIEDYNQAIRLDPNQADAFINRGNEYNNLGQYQQAIRDYNKSIKLDSNNADAFSNRGVAYSKLEQYQKAIESYNQAIRLDPDYAPAYNNMAWLKATCPVELYRDGDKAVSLAKKAIELDAEKKYLWLDTLAAAYAESGRFAEAVKTAERAIRLLPKEFDLYRNELIEHLDSYSASKPWRE